MTASHKRREEEKAIRDRRRRERRRSKPRSTTPRTPASHRPDASARFQLVTDRPRGTRRRALRRARSRSRRRARIGGSEKLCSRAQARHRCLRRGAGTTRVRRGEPRSLCGVSTARSGFSIARSGPRSMNGTSSAHRNPPTTASTPTHDAASPTIAPRRSVPRSWWIRCARIGTRTAIVALDSFEVSAQKSSSAASVTSRAPRLRQQVATAIEPSEKSAARISPRPVGLGTTSA